MYCVYLITNTVNEKVYVGQTITTPEQRLKGHIYGRKKQDYFHAAIRKHGSVAFVVQELGRYETREELNTAEKLWIILAGSHVGEVGYNSTFGGDFGAEPTSETRKKIGEASRKRRHTPETRLKMSEAHSGEKNHLFGLPKEQQPWFGRELTEEHKQNCSAARTSWWERKRAEGFDFDAYRMKISVAQRERQAKQKAEGKKRAPISEEGKANIKAAQLVRRAREAEQRASN